MGAMWFNSMNPKGMSNLRHFVEQGDKLDKYGWVWYDPRIGGKEVIIDSENNIQLNFTFVKSRSSDNWVVQVEGDVINRDIPTTESIVLYIKQNGEEDSSAFLNQVKTKLASDSDLLFSGLSKELGRYTLKVVDEEGKHYQSGLTPLKPDCDPSKPATLSLHIPDNQMWKAKEIFQTILTDSIQDHIQVSSSDLGPRSIPSALTIRNIHGFAPGNVHFIQKTFDGHFKFSMIFNKSGSKDQIEEGSIDQLIYSAYQSFKVKFDKTFTIPKGSKYQVFSEETFSNLLGGLAYFHGSQLIDRETIVDNENFENIDLHHSTEEGPYELFTMVPSRAFFPRGFYWDEGFHLLQIMDYDSDLALEVFNSWFSLIDKDGWIAREVILGDEARSKVPEEFRVQNPNIANPPTLLLAFSEILAQVSDYNEELLGLHENEDLEYLDSDSNIKGDELKKNPLLLISYAKNIYPNLLKHYEWFTTTQRGMIEEYLEIPSINVKVHINEAFRWVGRTFTHCLPSGMDDYPRALPPDIAELHVDALSWVAVMTRSMKQIATVLGLSADIERFMLIENNIIENLETLHWDESQNSYCDITINDLAEDDQDLRKFVCHEGYVTLLPFALKLIPSHRMDRIKHIIDTMSNTEKLFTPYGLSSLSKEDEFYNTGEVYWRGPIWININYLCLDALNHYFSATSSVELENEYQEVFKQARSLYKDLRHNLIENVYSVWKKDGYCYEHYNHKTGKGSGVQHFTGWTALVVNMIGKLPETI